jgi:hypothetical protein
LGWSKVENEAICIAEAESGSLPERGAQMSLSQYVRRIRAKFTISPKRPANACTLEFLFANKIQGARAVARQSLVVSSGAKSNRHSSNSMHVFCAFVD